ncbi:hypothetical protein ACW23B_19850 [Streptomyces albidoflavus]
MSATASLFASAYCCMYVQFRAAPLGAYAARAQARGSGTARSGQPGEEAD